MSRYPAVLLSTLVLAGCNLLPAPFGSADEPDKVIGLLAYAQEVTALSANEQRRELNAAAQWYSKHHELQEGVRLGLLLSLPGTAINDDARALTVLEPLLGPGGSAKGPLRQLAALLYLQVSDRAREQRKSAQLKEQLEALRAIERNIIERGQGRTR